MSVLQYILDLGSSVVMPLIITILGLILGQILQGIQIRYDYWNRIYRNQSCHRTDGGFRKPSRAGDDTKVWNEPVSD